MKNTIKIIASLLLMTGFVTACEENDPTPGYEVVGRSYETIAGVAVSNDEPIPGETITVTITYVNYDEEPASSVELVLLRDDNVTTLQTYDESGAAFGERVFTYSYDVPGDAAEGEEIILRGIFSAASKEFPQVEQATIEVQ